MSFPGWNNLAESWPIWLAAVGLAMYLLATIVLFGWILWNRRPRRQIHDWPGVSVLKPISGIDEELEFNIASFFSLDYPNLQLLFASERMDDPGMEIVRRVAARFPNCDYQIVTTKSHQCANLKIANLESMLPLAKHPLILLSDSNVRIEQGDLHRLVEPMSDPQCGLVYQAVVGVGEQTHSAFVENARLTEFAGVLTIGAKALFFQDIVMGKGMLCRRQALRDVGDFSAVRDVAADDHLLAMRILDAGWNLRLGSVPALVFHRYWTWRACYARHLRHAALRWRVCWPAYPLEILFSPIVCAIPALLLNGTAGALVWFLVVVAKILAELTGLQLLRGSLPPWRYWGGIIVKDLLFAVIWCQSLFVNQVSWRGIAYRITRGSRLVAMPSHPRSTATIASVTRQ